MAKKNTIIKTSQGCNGRIVMPREEPEPIKQCVYSQNRITPEFAHDLAVGLLEYVKNQEVDSMFGYFSNNGIPRSIVHLWASHHSELKYALEVARDIVGARRVSEGLKGNYNHSIVLATLPLFDQDYKDLLAWKAQISAPQQLATTEAKIVIMEKYRETDVVPKKEDE